MIKVTYYIGMNSKDTLKEELTKSDFITEFDKIFRDYTVYEAQGRFTNRLCEVTYERNLIVTTFIAGTDIKQVNKSVLDNVHILKDRLNQECILVEVSEPEVMFL